MKFQNSAFLQMLKKKAYISDQLFSAANSTAFSTSPMDRYISAAAFGSLMLLAHSAFFKIKDLLSWASVEDKNS